MHSKFILTITLLTLLCLALVQAETIPLELINEDTVTAIDAGLKGKELPGIIGTIFGNERANIHVQLTTGQSLVIGVTTESKKISGVSFGEQTKPTVHIYLSEGTISKLQDSADPLQGIREALEDGDITYEAVGFFKKIKFGFLFFMAKMFGGATPSGAEPVANEAVNEGSDSEQVNEEEQANVEEEVDDGEEVEAPVENSETPKASDEEPEPSEVETSVAEDDTPSEPTGAVAASVELLSDPEPTGPQEHIVALVDTGFEMDEIAIHVGDTITWDNQRDGKIEQAMIIGAQLCRAVKSEIFLPGESYRYTFDKAQTCTIVDGIMTTQIMKVFVE